MRLPRKKILGPVLGIVFSMTFAANSKADTFDTTLASPNNTPGTLSWYNGTGNQAFQSGFTVDTSNGIELGLRAKYRQGADIDSSTDVYNVAAGLQNPTHALWNYEWSIDLQPNGAGSGLTLGQIVASITITDEAGGPGSTVTFDPTLSLLGDCGFGNRSTTASACTGAGTDLPSTSGDWGAQNSENPLFFGVFPSSYNPNASDTYDISLTVSSLTGALLASDSIQVVVTPEPSAVVLFGTLALGLVVLGRRRLAKTTL